ncbi:hypothetical protein L4C34_15485 [Vibrio profundum]|uniref:hypothetical protein n=1 Tax=Vibrio profundum TaxID=2910247 RepID=UPI003D0E455C
MNFENRVLFSKMTGSTNREASLVWFDEIQEKVHSSEGGVTEPWVIFLDSRDWVGASLDAWEVNNQITDWVSSHGCVYEAIVLSKKMHVYAAKTELNDQPILHYFFDYDEAYQGCLDKLFEVQSTK